MTDEEFNLYCAEVKNLVIKEMTGDGSLWVTEPHRQLLDGWFYNPSKDLNQMAEVFDKLWMSDIVGTRQEQEFLTSALNEGIAQSMREFIESTREI